MIKTKKTRKEMALKQIQKWEDDAVDKLTSVQDKIENNDMAYSLEWNLLETGTMEEGKIAFAVTLKGMVTNNSLEEALNAVTRVIRILTDRLLGNDFLSELGPWDEHSTSPGSRRLAIIRCNITRFNRKRAKQIIDILKG